MGTMASSTKSGDSARQDADAARKADQKEALPNPENLLAKVQDAMDVRKELGATREQLAQSQMALAQLTQVVEELQKKVLTAATVQQAQTLATPTPQLKCPVCHQIVLNKTTKRGVCDGEHVPVRVLPKEPRFNRAFNGYIHSNVRYVGMCMLPKVIVDSVLSGISRWEQSQLDKTVPRGKMFSDQDVQHGLPGQGSLPLPNLVAEA